MQAFPSIFVSHGSPMILLEDTPARRFLKDFGKELGRPEAILIASAHFETRVPMLSADEKPDMIYDFNGFPQALFGMQYPAPGQSELAQRAAQMLNDVGIVAHTAACRGFDHGTWVPLKLMYPDADIPVVQISVQPLMSAAHHLSMGRALSALRAEGVLIAGSGSITHNLYEMVRSGMNAPSPEWVTGFANWTRDAIELGRAEEIADWFGRAPFALENHPTPEHFLPIAFALGAAGHRARGRRVHSSCEYGVLMMDAYTFS